MAKKRKPIPDPFKKPPVVKEGSDVSRALDRMLGMEGQDYVCIVSVRASEPQEVIGAYPLGQCRLCSELVWVAPSSLQLMEKKPVFLCLHCMLADPTIRALLNLPSV